MRGCTNYIGSNVCKLHVTNMSFIQEQDENVILEHV